MAVKLNKKLILSLLLLIASTLWISRQLGRDFQVPFQTPEVIGRQVTSTNVERLDSLIRLDSYWYLDIAENGYRVQPGQASNVVFFPLYPFLMRFVNKVTNIPVGIVGFLISWIFLFGLLIQLKRWCEYSWSSNQTDGTNGFLSLIFLGVLLHPAGLFSKSFTTNLFLFF